MYSVCVHAPVYVRMCVMYCTCPYSSQLQKKKLLFKFSRARSTQATVRQMRRRAFPFAHKSYAKAPRCLCFHVWGLRRHHAGKSVGRWRLALRVHRVRQPAKSKVAEFACKFKCLLPRATLNSDLHLDPLCCRMRESTTKENNFRCGCGRIDFILF